MTSSSRPTSKGHSRLAVRPWLDRSSRPRYRSRDAQRRASRLPTARTVAGTKQCPGRVECRPVRHAAQATLLTPADLHLTGSGGPKIHTFAPFHVEPFQPIADPYLPPLRGTADEVKSTTRGPALTQLVLLAPASSLGSFRSERSD